MTIRDRKNPKNKVSMAEMLELLSQYPAGAKSSLAANAATEKSEELSQISLDLESSLSSLEREEFEKAQAAVSFLGLVRKDLSVHSIADQSTVVPLMDDSRVYTKEDTTPEDFSGRERGHDSNTNHFNQLGRFEIERSIGVGGFANVFLALDPLLNRKIALKIPKPQVLFSEEARERFQREAKLAAVLSHPAIVPVFECGAVGPITYIASGYCPGLTLAEWFSKQDRKTQPETAARIIARLADAIEHAHQRGVIHRDLKPANVLVEDGGGDDVAQCVRITDFGLAKLTESDADDSITLDGAVVGTPAYMSPEQAMGKQDIDFHTDLFSLGTIFYELLTGKMPFKKKSHLSTLRAVESEVPVDPRRLNPAVSKDLQAICMKCLSKDPARRYESAHLLARDLENALRGRTIKARPVSSWERIGRWTRRNPALAFSQAAAFLFLAIGLSISTWQWQVNQASLVISNQQKNRAETNVAQLHQTVVGVLGKYRKAIEENIELAEIDRQVIGEMLVVHKRLIDEEAEQLVVTPETLQAYVEIAELYFVIGELDEADETCDQARQLVELVTESDPVAASELQVDELEVVIKQGAIANFRGRHELAESIIRNCLVRMAACEHQQEEPDAKYRWMRLHRLLGLVLHAQDRLEPAAVAFKEGMTYAAQLVALDPENEGYQFSLGRSFQDVSNSYRSSGDIENTIRSLETALTHFINMSQDETNKEDYRYRIAFLQSDLASVYGDKSDLDTADRYLSIALQSFRDLVNEKPMDSIVHNRLVQALARMTGLREKQGRFEESLALHQEGYKEVDHLAGEYRQMRGQLYFRVHQARLLRDQFDEPEKVDQLLEEALAIGEACVAEFPTGSSARWRLITAYELKSLIAAENEDIEEALRLRVRSSEHRFSSLRLKPESRGRQKRSSKQTQTTARMLSKHQRYDGVHRILTMLSNASPDSHHIQYDVARYLADSAKDQAKAKASRATIKKTETMAIDYLNLAVELGFSKASSLENDRRWDSLRDSSEFRHIFSALTKNSTQQR